MTEDMLADLAADARAEFIVAKAREEAISEIRQLAKSLAGRGFQLSLDLEESDGQVVVLRIDLDDLRLAEGPLSILTARADRFETEVSGPGPDEMKVNMVSTIRRLEGQAVDLEEDQPKAEAQAPQPKPATCKPATPESAKTGPYSQYELDVIDRMLKRREPVKEIAITLGRAYHSVYQKIRALGEAAPKPAAEPAPSGDRQDALTFTERTINIHLNNVGYVDGWTAERDLKLAECLARGDGAFAAGAALGLEKQVVLDRWSRINTDRGSLDHQAALLSVLRHRAAGAE